MIAPNIGSADLKGRETYLLLAFDWQVILPLKHRFWYYIFSDLKSLQNAADLIFK